MKHLTKIALYSVLLLTGFRCCVAQVGPAEAAAASEFETQVNYLPYAERLIFKVEKRDKTTWGMDVVVTNEFLKLSVERRRKIASELQGDWYSCLKDNNSKIDNRKWAALVFWDKSGRCVANTVSDNASYIWVRDDVGDARKAREGQRYTYTYSPKVGSKERADILAALKAPISKEAKGTVTFKVKFLKVSRGWAFVKVDALLPEKSKEPFLWGKVNALLHKKGAKWDVPTYGWASDAEMKESIISEYPEVPRSILQ